MTLKDKIINGEKLDKLEVMDLVYEDADLDYELVEEIMHDHGRWMMHMETIIKIDDKYYSIIWDRGLTEYQENEFYGQIAKPVVKKEIISYKWVREEL